MSGQHTEFFGESDISALYCNHGYIPLCIFFQTHRTCDTRCELQYQLRILGNRDVYTLTDNKCMTQIKGVDPAGG